MDPISLSAHSAIKPNKQQPVDAAERDSLRGFAPQQVELMAKDKVLGF